MLNCLFYKQVNIHKNIVKQFNVKVIRLII